MGRVVALAIFYSILVAALLDGVWAQDVAIGGMQMSQGQMQMQMEKGEAALQPLVHLGSGTAWEPASGWRRFFQNFKRRRG